MQLRLLLENFLRDQPFAYSVTINQIIGFLQTLTSMTIFRCLHVPSIISLCANCSSSWAFSGLASGRSKWSVATPIRCVLPCRELPKGTLCKGIPKCSFPNPHQSSHFLSVSTHSHLASEYVTLSMDEDWVPSWAPRCSSGTATASHHTWSVVPST